MASIENRKLLVVMCIGFFCVNTLLFVVSYLRFMFADAALHSLLDYDAAGYMLPVYLILPLFIFFLMLMTVPLPFICKGSLLAYRVFFVGAVLSLLYTLFSGVRVLLPLESFLIALLYMFWGGILMAFRQPSTRVKDSL
jgi:hypothetical protein